jgi:hypothetical protein
MTVPRQRRGDEQATTLVTCTRDGVRHRGAQTVTGVLRGVEYSYCCPDCRALHAVAIDAEPRCCAECHREAVGDTGRCDLHLSVVSTRSQFALAH